MAIQNQTDLDLMNETGSRSGTDRRENNENKPVQERRKVQRRRQIDPTTCERDYSQDEIEFMQALDQYKRDSGRMFPTCSEILEVIRALGYFKPEWIEDEIEPAPQPTENECESKDRDNEVRSLNDIDQSIDTFGEFPE